MNEANQACNELLGYGRRLTKIWAQPLPRRAVWRLVCLLRILWSLAP